MTAKLIGFFVLAAVFSTGQCVEEIRLPDETRNHVSNPFFGTTCTIPRFWLETLLSCYVVFPNGIMYEIHPYTNLDFPGIYAESNSCYIGFRGVPESASGTYELWSLVEHLDKSRTLSKLRCHLNVTMSDLEFPEVNWK